MNAALAIINQLDELDYAGSTVVKIRSKYWRAPDLAKQLENALSVEGWRVSTNPTFTSTISILPVEYSNDIFVFTKMTEALNRVKWWANELDQPAALSAGSGGGVQRATTSTAGGVGQGTASPSFNRGGRFTVDPLGNRIVFTGTANEYDKIIRLLETLDTPAPEVLIEVQIAEVSLEDSTSSGIEILNFDDLGNNSVSATARNSGLGLGSSGLNVGILTGNIEAQLNAFASNRRVKVLSTPVLVARSGGSASIQVGTDVPIITSQGASPTQSQIGVTDILQNVEYRSTGVLLNIEPIVFSGNRIDLTVTQEVSATIDVSNSSISSPTISNRSISTQLSLEDGATAVMGGLIQENLIRSDTGIPFLKDIPGVGAAFSVDSYSVDRTELVVLITAYVIRGQEDKTRFVQYLSSRVEGLLRDDQRLLTLNPIVK